MLALGVSMAVLAGVGFNAAAALQKREAVKVDRDLHPSRLLVVLGLRRRWLAATALDLLSWVAEVVALAYAPIEVVVPLIAAGGALLVVLGIRWLGEHFGPVEILALVLVGVGATVAAVAAGPDPVSHAPLSFGKQLAVGAVALGVGVALASGRHESGIAYGTAAGALFAATAVLSKEVGDRFAAEGLQAVRALAESPVPWGLIALGAAGTAFIQKGFQRSNAASVAAAMSTVETTGPIVAAFVLYMQPYPRGPAGVALAVGVAGAVAGAALLAVRTPILAGGEPRSEVRPPTGASPAP